MSFKTGRDFRVTVMCTRHIFVAACDSYGQGGLQTVRPMVLGWTAQCALYLYAIQDASLVGIDMLCPSRSTILPSLLAQVSHHRQLFDYGRCGSGRVRAGAVASSKQVESLVSVRFSSLTLAHGRQGSAQVASTSLVRFLRMGKESMAWRKHP